MALTDEDKWKLEWIRRGTTVLSGSDPALEYADPTPFATEQIRKSEPLPDIKSDGTDSAFYRQIGDDPDMLAKYEQLPAKEEPVK